MRGGDWVLDGKRVGGGEGRKKEVCALPYSKEKVKGNV
jgi:hypothetical protein